MPIDVLFYGGIFDYAIIQLLKQPERRRFISNCYQEPAPSVCILFTVISTKAWMFGKGKMLCKKRFQIDEELNTFSYY
jgi:hypothetical protein